MGSRGIMSLVPEGGGVGHQGQGVAPPPGPGDTLSALPGILKQSLRLEQADGAPETRSAFQQAILPPLDYARIADDLEGAENSEVAGLLQALRWRISKSPAGNDRLRVVMTFVEQDVLRCSGSSFSSSRHGAPASLVEAMADRTDGPVAEELARLVNCMASTAAGRAYLLQPGSGTVATLVQLLTAIPSMDTLNGRTLRPRRNQPCQAPPSNTPGWEGERLAPHPPSSVAGPPLLPLPPPCLAFPGGACAAPCRILPLPLPLPSYLPPPALPLPPFLPPFSYYSCSMPSPPPAPSLLVVVILLLLPAKCSSYPPFPASAAAMSFCLPFAPFHPICRTLQALQLDRVNIWCTRGRC